MLSFGSSRRYLLWRGSTDMRKGIDSLGGQVREHLKADPMSGDVYIFMNGKRNQMKMLVWDRSGYVLYWKRLEAGTFELPGIEGTNYHIPWSTLVMILEGIEIKERKQKKRYNR